MKIITEVWLEHFDAWSGAKDTLEVLTTEQIRTIEGMLEDLYPDGMTDTELNDFLWFENDTIAEWLGFEDWEELEKENNS